MNAHRIADASDGSGGPQRAVEMPCYGVIETVVAPEQLSARNKGRGAKDVQMLRCARVVIIGAPDGVRVCGCDDAVWILADLA